MKFVIVSLIACVVLVLFGIMFMLQELIECIKDMTKTFNNVRYHLECIDNSLRK